MPEQDLLKTKYALGEQVPFCHLIRTNKYIELPQARECFAEIYPKTDLERFFNIFNVGDSTHFSGSLLFSPYYFLVQGALAKAEQPAYSLQMAFYNNCIFLEDLRACNERFGFGRPFVNNLVTFAREVGVEKIAIEINLEGSWWWPAKHGVSPVKGYWDELKRGLFKRLMKAKPQIVQDYGKDSYQDLRFHVTKVESLPDGWGTLARRDDMIVSPSKAGVVSSFFEENKTESIGRFLFLHQYYRGERQTSPRAGWKGPSF